MTTIHVGSLAQKTRYVDIISQREILVIQAVLLNHDRNESVRINEVEYSVRHSELTIYTLQSVTRTFFVIDKN